MALKDYKNSKLKRFNITKFGQIIFVQKFTELLYHDTFHSYQYMVHNTYTLISEILDTIKDVQSDVISVNHLRKQVEELKYFAENDIVLEQKFRKELYVIKSIKDKKIKSEEPYSIRNLEYQLKGVFHALKVNYFNSLLDTLEKEINYESPDITIDNIENLTQ